MGGFGLSKSTVVGEVVGSDSVGLKESLLLSDFVQPKEGHRISLTTRLFSSVSSLVLCILVTALQFVPS